MPKVFIINDSGHNFSKAERFGELVFLSKGVVDPYSTNKSFRFFWEKLKEAKEGDFILVTSLASLNVVAGWVIGSLGINLNLLLFQDGDYLVRELSNRIIKERN